MATKQKTKRTSAQQAYLDSLTSALSRNKKLATDEYNASVTSARAQDKATRDLLNSQYANTISGLDTDYTSNQTQIAQQLQKDIASMMQNVSNDVARRGVGWGTIAPSMSKAEEGDLRVANTNALSDLTNAYTSGKASALTTRDAGIANAKLSLNQLIADALNARNTTITGAQNNYDTTYTGYLADLAAQAAARSGSGRSGSTYSNSLSSLLAGSATPAASTTASQSASASPYGSNYAPGTFGIPQYVPKKAASAAYAPRQQPLKAGAKSRMTMY